MRNKNNNDFNINLKNHQFKEIFPWIGGDLQTIRDTFCFDLKRAKSVERIYIPIDGINNGPFKKNYLLGYLEVPKKDIYPKGLVFLTHGLGGSTKRFGLRRIAKELLHDGYAVFKLNLRGAGSGRYLTNSNYSARCSEDIITAINFLKNNYLLNNKRFNLDMKKIPIFGVGLSLGGTILLNASLDYKNVNSLFDGIACVSTPLDLHSSSQCIEKSRNYLYQKWLIKRLKKQLLMSEFSNKKELFFKKIKSVKTIREFDETFTAPSWGYQSVNDYYSKASPLNKIKDGFYKLPFILLIHSKDDPWVPFEPTMNLKNNLGNQNKISILITEKGGHNGFHSAKGCWSDYVVKKWLNSLL